MSLIQPFRDSNKSTTKITSTQRKFFNTNTETKTNNIPRRIITTRRTSLIESDLSHITSSIYDHPKTTINNQNSI